MKLDYSRRAKDPTYFIATTVRDGGKVSTVKVATIGKLYDDKGKVVVSIPLVDYALLVKGYYDQMSDQEYLDRQDVYEMVFFLNDGMSWVSSHIFINSWKVVLSGLDLD